MFRPVHGMKVKKKDFSWLWWVVIGLGLFIYSLVSGSTTTSSNVSPTHQPGGNYFDPYASDRETAAAEMTLDAQPDIQNTYFEGTIPPTLAITYQPITWTELESFLEVDPTNINAKNTYDANFYNCVDFSINLVENAKKKNIKAWIVIVDFYNEENGHAFVGFETSDLGVVFIEPQLDIRTNNPVVGQLLCLAWGNYKCMGTIKSIEYDQCDHSHHCIKYTP